MPRRYASTASKSDVTKQTRPFCSQQDVAYVRRSTKANSTSAEPWLQGCVPMGPLGSDDSPPDMSEVRLWRIACHHHAGPGGLQTAASI
jgi:hypothetical protein